MIHAHVSVVHATKAKLGANISHSDAGHRQVVLQATQLQSRGVVSSAQLSSAQLSTAQHSRRDECEDPGTLSCLLRY
jgi:hypothetical protein